MCVEINVYPPSPALSDFIDGYWHTIVPGPVLTNEMKVLPSGFIDLIVHRSPLNFQLVIRGRIFHHTKFLIAGLWTIPYTACLSEGIEAFAIRVKPEAMVSLFGMPASCFVNSPADLTEILSEEYSAFCANIQVAEDLTSCMVMADSFFLQRAICAKRRDGYVYRASALIRKNVSMSVEELSDEVCISRRQLEREFRRSLGISPKMYIRISRMNRMLALLKSETQSSVSQLSSAAGYFDQAHFIKDFTDLAGEAPATFLGRLRKSKVSPLLGH